MRDTCAVRPWHTRLVAARLIVAGTPAAGDGRAPALAERAVARLRGAGHDVVRLEAGDAATLDGQLRARVAGGIDAVVVVGGDGMVHLAVNVLARTAVHLGIVPAGTGNDVA